MVALFISNAFLLAQGPIYYASFVAQVALYFLAGLGYARNGKTRRSKLLLIPFYFVSMNVALALGMLKALFQKDQGSWDRVERSALILGQQVVSEETHTNGTALGGALLGNSTQPAPLPKAAHDLAQPNPRLKLKELSS
jgi:hypothetical protein